MPSCVLVSGVLDRETLGWRELTRWVNMNRKALIYSGALLVSLVVVSVLVGTGLVRAIQDAADLSFTTPPESNVLGSERHLHGEILFPNEEAVTVSAIELKITQNSPTSGTPVDIYLPLEDLDDFIVDFPQVDNPGQVVIDILDDPLNPNDGSVGTLRITAEFDGVVEFETSTLPGSTIPPGGGQFKGITPGARIVYDIYWTAPEQVEYVGLYDAQLFAHINAGQGGDIVPSPTASFEITLPNVDISIESEQTVGEANGPVSLTVTADPAPLADVVVSYDTATGTATAGDYTGGPGQVTILANESSATIEIEITNDTADEFDETFTVILTGVTGPGIVNAANDTATVTIVDEDVPIVSFVTDSLSVAEGSGPAVHVVQADIAPKENIVISWAKTEGTATSVVDYGALSPNVTILANELTGSRSTNIVNDVIDERDETFTAELTTIVSGEATIGAPSTQTITILDNDAHPTVVTPDAADIVEGTGGTTTLELTVGLSAPSDFDITVTVEAGAAGDTATVGDDFTLGGTDTVTFIGGSGSVEETLSIDIVTDAIDEFDETFTVLWSAASAQTDGDGDPQISNAETVTTIIDDDVPALSAEPSTFSEGATSYEVTVSSDIAPKQDISVRVRVLGGLLQRDLATVAAILTIPAGQFSGSVLIEDDVQAPDVVNDDLLDEDDETFSMVIGGLGVPADANFTIARNDSTLTVTDNDATPTLQADAFITLDAEGDVGKTLVSISLTLSAVSGLPVQFDYATGDFGGDGSATPDVDFDSSNDTIIIPPGDSGATVRIAVNGDTDIEGDERFPVDFTNGITSNRTVTIDPEGTIVTIVDDDFATNISIGDVTVDESGGNVIDAGQPNEFQLLGYAAVAIRTDAPAKSTITFEYEISDGSATGQDYGGTQSGTWTIGRGQDRVILVFPINDDKRDENNETVNVTISNASNGGTITDGDSVVTITDNDETPSVVLLVLPSDHSLREGEVNPEQLSAGQAFRVVAAISPTSDTTVSDFPIDVKYRLFQGSALPTLDYAPVLAGDVTRDGLLTILANDIVSQDADLISVVDDELVEGDEVFSIEGDRVTSNGATLFVEDGAFGPDTIINGVPAGQIHDLTILDNDAGFVLSIIGTQVSEDTVTGTATVTVKADRVISDVPGAVPATVDVVTSDGKAVDGQDYTGGTYQATIAVGSDTGTVQIPIIDDDIDEDLDSTPPSVEDFIVTLSNQSTNSVINQKKKTAKVLIVDDDPFPGYELIDTTVTIDEGTPLAQAIGATTPANIRLRILGESALAFTIPFQTGDGVGGVVNHAAQASDDDYVHQQRGGVVVAPGATEVTAIVEIGQDSRYEANENAQAFFPGAVGPKTVRLIIQNDDAPIAVDDVYNVLEGGSLRTRPGANPGGVLNNDEQVVGIQLTARNESLPNSVITQQFIFAEIGRFAGGFQFKTKPNSITEDTDLTFEYVAIEQNGFESDPATVTIQVENKPDPVQNRGRSFNRNSQSFAQALFEVPVEEGALAGEPAGKIAVLVDDIPAEHGVLNLQPDGSFTYDTIGTAGDYLGNTFFTFRIADAVPTAEVFGDETLAAYLICQGPCFDVSVPSLTVNEDAGTFSFDVTLTNGAASDNSSAIIEVQDGSAVGGGDDFTFTTASVSLNAGNSTVTHTVTLHDDAGTPVFEGGETFNIVLRNAGGSGEAAGTTIPLAQGENAYTITITIQDDEDIPVIDISDDSKGEDVTPASVDVTVTGAHSIDVTVDYEAISPNTADAATQGTDYDVTSGTLTFTATLVDSSVSLPIDVPINDDSDAEGDEVFYVELTNVANALLNNDIGIVTIIDNEVAQNDNYSMSEDDVLTTDASTGVLVNDTVPAGEEAVANLVTDLQAGTGTLVLNADGSFTYTPPANFTGPATFQYDFASTLTADLNSNVADVTITVENLNDDPVAVAVAYDATPGETLQVAAVAGLLSNAVVTDIDGPVLSVQVVQQPGHGVLNVGPDGSFDYTPSELTSTTFTFKVVDSLGGESDETVASLNLPPSFDITLSKTAADEDVDVQLIATIDLYNADPNASSQVTVSTVSGTATVGDDVVQLTQSVELSVTTPQQQIVIAILNDAADPVREGLETFGVRLENATNAVILESAGGQRTDDVTIDDPADTPTLSIGDVTVTEGTGAQSQATVPVTQTGKTAFTASVDFATSDGTATEAADYTATNGTLNFPINTVNQTKTLNIPVDVTDDNVLEGDETFIVTLSNAQGSTIADGEATVTIDDDESLPQADDDVYSTDEDTLLSVTIQDGVIGNDTSTPAGLPLDAVLVSDVSNGALELNADGSFTYTPNENSNGVDTFTYKATQGVFESNVATVTITVNAINDVPVANNDFFFVAPDGAINETAPGILGNDSDVEDSTGQLTVVNVVPSLGDLSQTLTVGTDGSVIYDPNGNASVTTFTYQVQDSDGGESNVATVRLGQIPSFTLTVSPTTIAEDNLAQATVTATITLNNPHALSVDSFVDLVVAGGDGNTIGIATVGTAQDDVLDASQVQIPMNDQTTSTQVTITINDDDVREGNEVFTVSLANADVDSALSGTVSFDVTITDEEDVPVLTIGDATVNEGAGTVDVIVTLTGQTVFGASVDYATLADTATEGSDYTGVSGPINFPANTTQALITDTVTIVINDDGEQELNETFQVTLSNATGATIGDGSADVTITDNDLAQITIDDVSVSEGTGTVAVTVRKDIVTLVNVTVDLLTNAGTASATDDFTPVLGETVTIPAGALSTVFNITLVNDALDELDETFTVDLSNESANAQIADSSATVTILDDDATPELSIQATASVNEREIGDTDTETLTITLSAASGLPVTVTIDTADNTATGGADYTAITGQIINFAPGDTTKTVAVDILGDDEGEADETFNVVMSSPTNASLAAGQDTTVVTIVDDDGEITVATVLVSGFNLIGVPVDTGLTVTPQSIAEDLLPAGTDITAGPVQIVLAWNPAFQSFKLWTPFGGVNDPINLADGFFIRVNQQVTWTVTGAPIADPINLDLGSGFNLVSFPAISGSEITPMAIAEGLLPAGTDITAGPVQIVLAWNTAFQSFKLWTPFGGVNDQIDANPEDGIDGAFIRLTSAQQFSP